MTPLNFALYFTSVFVANIAHMATLKQLYFQSDNVGGSVTLPCVCDYDEGGVMLYWYKQSLGHKPKLVCSAYSYSNNGTFQDEFSNNRRFSLETVKGKNHLKISDLQMSDAATYFCVVNNFFDFEFCDGATVSIKGSRFNVTASVQQSASETIQPGASVTLNCTVHTGTCDGEHSVYWFKSSEESHPGLIYTRGGRDDQCERKPSTQTHSCVYNLPMKSLNLSRAGTYYCAVASCGRILFGDGTKLDFEDEVDSLVLVYILSAALAFTTILVILLVVSVYKMNQRNWQCTERNAATSALDTACQDAESLHYAALRHPDDNRARRQRDDMVTECVYSGVRQ